MAKLLFLADTVDRRVQQSIKSWKDQKCVESPFHGFSVRKVFERDIEPRLQVILYILERKKRLTKCWNYNHLFSIRYQDFFGLLICSYS